MKGVKFTCFTMRYIFEEEFLIRDWKKEKINLHWFTVWS
jgi:hypothetical protein